MKNKIAWLLLCAFAIGCPQAAKKPPTLAEQQATFRAAVVISARAINEADKVCAFVARSKVDENIAEAKDLARRCDAAYDKARDSLIAVDDLIDGFESKNVHKVTCGLMVANQQLALLISMLEPAISDAMRDAIQFVEPLAMLCPNYASSADAGAQ